MLKLSFSIPMVPVGKARARVTKNGTYTPKATRIAEKTVRDYAFEAMQRLARTNRVSSRPTDRAVALAVRFLFPIPRTWSKAKRQAALEGRLMHTSKPDLDNLLKLVKDAMNGVVFVDDCQIVTEVANKDYGGIGRIEVELAEVVPLEPALG